MTELWCPQWTIEGREYLPGRLGWDPDHPPSDPSTRVRLRCTFCGTETMVELSDFAVWVQPAHGCPAQLAAWRAHYGPLTDLA